MATELNNDLINELATKYAQTKSDATFRELFEHLRPMVHNEAMKAERDQGIPKETMISHFNERIWRAVDGDGARNYDGSTNFSQRFHTFFKQRLIDEVKYRQADKRDALVESLDKMIPGSESGSTYVEAISENSRSAEQEFLDDAEVTETLEGFRTSNERHGLVIEMLYRGYSNDEIAQRFGSDTYDDRIRALVKRARQSFRAYLDKRKTSEYS